MRIAIAQMNTKSGDFDATVEAMVSCSHRAADQGADLLVFPVPTLMGFDPKALLDYEGYTADAAAALVGLRDRLEVPSLVPLMFDAQGSTGCEVALVRDGELRPLRLASWIGMAAAGDGTEEGDESVLSSAAPAFSLCGVDFAIAMSADELDAVAQRSCHADAICYLPIAGYDTDEEDSCLAPSVSDDCFVQEARRSGAWIVAAGAVGAYDDAVFCGGSFAMAPWGELAAVAPSFAPHLLVFDLDPSLEGPLADPVTPPAYDRRHVLWEALVLALRDQVEKRGFDGVGLVLDGTMPSSALAALAVDAVGPLRVSALVCARDRAALEDARTLARTLRVREVDELASEVLGRAVLDLGADDTEALLRGLVEARLGALCQAGHLLALSAVDKTALAVGLGPDAACAAARAVAYAPFGDVYRSDVLALARQRNASSAALPASSLRRLEVPSGLGLEGLTDVPERQLSELDAVLLGHIERAMGLTELVATHAGAEVAPAVVNRFGELGAFRAMGPACPVVSACSLAEAARPLTDAWHDRVRDDEPGEGAVDLASLVADVSSGASLPHQPAGRKGRGEASGRVSEVLGYLQELSDGRRLRDSIADDGNETDEEGRKDAPSFNDLWSFGLFSDN